MMLGRADVAEGTTVGLHLVLQTGTAGLQHDAGYILLKQDARPLGV